MLLECVTFRTLGHVLSDKNEYMDQDQLAEQIANDPVASSDNGSSTTASPMRRHWPRSTRPS